MIMTLFHNQFLFFSVGLMLLLCNIKPQNNEINLELSLPVWYLLRDFIFTRLLPFDRYEIDSCNNE